MRESHIQSQCIRILKQSGYIVLRLGNVSHRGMPDILAIGEGDIFFVEFKNEKGRLSEIQNAVIKELSSRGFDVYVVRSIGDMRQVIKMRHSHG